jgi:hypothetical protein
LKCGNPHTYPQPNVDNNLMWCIMYYT